MACGPASDKKKMAYIGLTAFIFSGANLFNSLTESITNHNLYTKSHVSHTFYCHKTILLFIINVLYNIIYFLDFNFLIFNKMIIIINHEIHIKLKKKIIMYNILM